MIDATKIFAALPEYPIDQIFYYNSGSLAVGVGPTGATTSFAHGKGTTFFWKMIWTPDAGVNWYQEGFGPYTTFFGTYAALYEVRLEVTSTNVIVNIINRNVGNPVTIQWRIVGYSKS